MIISQIEIYKSPIKLKEPFVISLGLVDHAENVIVVIRTSNGISGFGECSPFMTINWESMDTCFIVGQYIAKALLGKNPLKIEECSQLMNKNIYGNSSIKSAFDVALYDISSQNANLPLYSFLGGKKNKSLITDYTVSIGDPYKMADDARKIKENGFQIIKVIVYCDFDTPLMLVEDPVTGGITYDSKGEVTLPGENGLGAVIEENYLKQLTGAVIK